jgi:hypothetical protein
MTDLTVQDRRSAAIEQAQLSPMEALESRIIREGDIEKMRELLKFRNELQQIQAKQLFTEAMAAFKAENIRVGKDKDNKQYNSKYTSIGNLVDTVTPYLSKHGLSANWDIDQANGIKVTCTITHRAGYSHSVSMQGPPDTSGQKNALQQIKSTVTYLKIGTFEAACGLASVDGNQDDDGNGFNQAPGGEMEPGAEADFLASIEGSASIDELKRNYEPALKAALSARDEGASKRFSAAKNERYKALKKEGW